MRSDPTSETIYNYLKERADEDGFVVAGAPSIAQGINRPTTTVSNALGRLQRRGKIAMLSYGQYAVMEIADQSEPGEA